MDPQPAGSIPVIVITGPVGSGKSTVAEAMAELLGNRDIRHALIDLDYLRSVHPHPDGDPFGVKLGLRNLAATWPNLLETGLRCVIVADVVEDKAATLAAYESAMPGTKITIVRLNVPLPVILRRLEGRETEITIDWYRHRAPELQGIMDRGKVEDVLIEVGERTPHDVASEILQRLDVLTADPLGRDRQRPANAPLHTRTRSKGSLP